MKTSNLQQTLANVSTIVAFKTINGTSFVGVRGYKNSKDEVSNQTFLVGVNYANILANDLKALKAFDIKPLIKEFSKDDVSKAYTQLLESLIKRTASEAEKQELREANDTTIKRSDAQSDAYESVAKGLKMKDNELYVYGLCVKKTVLVEGNYPIVNSRLNTIIKNRITKDAKLKGGKFRQFSLGQAEALKVQGFTI